MVILGEPGSGKTTLARYFAYAIAVEEWDTVPVEFKGTVPIVIRAADFAAVLKEAPGLSFFEYVIQYHTTKFGDLFRWAIKRSNALMIIDGIDEVPEATLRGQAVRKIELFVGEFRRNRFMITSRPVGYRQNQFTAGFHHLTLAEFSDQQARDFLVKWHLAVEEHCGSQDASGTSAKRASDLWSAIKRNQGIRKLAANPLLLTIIALTHLRGTKLPDRRVELYQIATETLLENWPLKERNLDLSASDLLLILEPIAHHVLALSDRNLIPEHELRPLLESQVASVQGLSLAEARIKARATLGIVEQHTGFFLERGLDDNGQQLYGFLHLTFAEYLTARYLAARWAADELELQQYVHDARWDEVLLLMGGVVGTWSVPSATKIVTDVLTVGSPYESLLHRDFLLAARILGDNVRVEPSLGAWIVSRLVSTALATPYSLLFRACASRLSEIATWLPGMLRSGLLEDNADDGLEERGRKLLLRAVTGDRNTASDQHVAADLLASETSSDWLRRQMVDWLCREAEFCSGRFFVLRPDDMPVLLTDDEAMQVLLRHPEVGDVKEYLQAPEGGRVSRYLVVDLEEIDSTTLARLIQRSGEELILELAFSGQGGATGLTKFVIPRLLTLATSGELSQARLAADTITSICRAIFEVASTSRQDYDVYRAAAAELSATALERRDKGMQLSALRADIAMARSDDVPDFMEYLLKSDDPRLVIGALSAFAPFEMDKTDELRERVAQPLRALAASVDSGVAAVAADKLIGEKIFNADELPALIEKVCVSGWIEDVGHLGQTIGNLLRVLEEEASTESVEAVGRGVIRLIESTVPRLHGHVTDSMITPFFELGEGASHRLAQVVLSLTKSPDYRQRCAAIAIWSVLRSEHIPSEHLADFLDDSHEAVVGAALKAMETVDLKQPSVMSSLRRLLHSRAKVRVAGLAATALSLCADWTDQGWACEELGIALDEMGVDELIFGALWRLLVSTADDQLPF